jgi:hypothetical protein
LWRYSYTTNFEISGNLTFHWYRLCVDRLSSFLIFYPWKCIIYLWTLCIINWSNFCRFVVRELLIVRDRTRRWKK